MTVDLHQNTTLARLDWTPACQCRCGCTRPANLSVAVHKFNARHCTDHREVLCQRCLSRRRTATTRFLRRLTRRFRPCCPACRAPLASAADIFTDPTPL